MNISEMNAIRSTVRTPVVENFLANYPTATNLVGTQKYYIETATPDGTLAYVCVEFSVPAWTGTDKRPAFNLEDAQAVAQQKYDEKEATKAANAAKRAENAANPKPTKVDNTEYDARIVQYLAMAGEPITGANLYAAHEGEWGEKETRGKLTSALTRLANAGVVTSEKIKDEATKRVVSVWSLV